MLAGSDLISHLWENSHSFRGPWSVAEHVVSAPHFWQTERIRTRSPSSVISREKSGNSEFKCGDMWKPPKEPILGGQSPASDPTYSANPQDWRGLAIRASSLDQSAAG